MTTPNARRIYALTVSLVCLLMLAACGPEPTPFPVELPPTPSPTPPPEALPPLRYALAPNTGGTIPDLDVILGTAEVIPLLDSVNPADLGTTYDIVVRYGVTAPDSPEAAEGWRNSELTPRVTLVMNTNTAPLAREDLRDVLQRSLAVNALVDSLAIDGASFMLSDTPALPATASQLRTELANSGLPDGFALAIGTNSFPGVELIAGQIQAAGMDVALLPMNNNQALTALESGRIQAALMVWALDSERQTWVSRFGEAAVVDLFTLPVSYHAADGLNLSFTAAGFPLISR